MDNHYDHATGEWVTADGRYAAFLGQPRFAALADPAVVLVDPARAWPVLLDLLATVPDDLLHLVGAGPLESFIVRHGAAYAGALEAEASRSPRFRRAFLGVNLARGELPAAVEARLVAAFGPQFTLLPSEAA